MFKIEFYLNHNEQRWSGLIHQLNSDILRRHVCQKLPIFDRNVSFSFCEQSSSGEILNGQGESLGQFSIQ
ncbi:Uncharacterised protein [Vibrio furnissii]|nr:hypothetical protein vfu_B00389 [Vibrio furnissii NCTC 11218]QDC94446.1 hypothetical protein FIU11_17045 [Vibrio furnissii]SUQ33602.1 Uncharacterised protein [Vibrio furnissii]